MTTLPLPRTACITIVLILLVGLLATAAPAWAADLRPSWECLPAETVAMVRVPEGRGFIEALAARTKWGGVMLAPDRWQQIRTRLAAWLAAGTTGDESAELLEKISAKLASFGLEEGDLGHAFDGEAGVALVMAPESDTVPLVIGWIEPGEAVAKRMLASMGRMYEDAVTQAGDRPFPLRRIDLDMAGRAVMSVQLPVVREDRLLATVHLFVTQIGDRLLLAIVAEPRRVVTLEVGVGNNPGNPQPGIEIKEREFTEAETANTAQGLEAARREFERFLARHEDAGEAAIAEWLDAPGLRAAMPGGIPLVEILIRPLIPPADSPAKKPLEKFGLDSLGPIMWRQSLDGDCWRSHAFISLPAPRRGPARILDEAPDAATVPSFVTREVITFRQISVDLGSFYSMLRDALLDGEEPPPGNIFGTLESQSLAMLGAQLPSVLGGFGSRHWMLSFPWNLAAEVAEWRKAKRGGSAGNPPDAAGGSPVAIIWEVKDEAPFQKLMQMAAAASGGEPKEEQGFRSVHLPGGLSLALGQKHLVVAIGEGVAEKTLAAIRNPPAAESALAGSEIERRAHELIAPEPGFLYSLGDERRSGGWIGMAGALMAAMEPDDLRDGTLADPLDPADSALLALMKAIFPTPAEIEGAIGATTTLWRATDDGILLRTASEMPAP